MPNLGFMDQLCEYEVEIDGNQGDPSIDTYKYTEWYTSADPTGVPDLANEVDDGMFAAIPDAYPVIEGLSHRVSTLVARAILRLGIPTNNFCKFRKITLKKLKFCAAF